jgi:gliding motility-associated-like protein
VALFGWCFFLTGCVAENDDDDRIIFVSCHVDQSDVFVCEDISGQADFYFSPNDDGYNDFFIVKSSVPDEIVSLNIYTRAGVLVFSIEAVQCVWDGRSLSGEKMAEGIYFYTAEVKDPSSKASKHGFVHLYR